MLDKITEFSGIMITLGDGVDGRPTNGGISWNKKMDALAWKEVCIEGITEDKRFIFVQDDEGTTWKIFTDLIIAIRNGDDIYFNTKSLSISDVEAIYSKYHIKLEAILQNVNEAPIKKEPEKKKDPLFEEAINSELPIGSFCSIDGMILKVVNPFTIKNLRDQYSILEEDLKILTNLIGNRTHYTGKVILTEKLLNKIHQECPRVLGVLITNYRISREI